MNGDMFLILVQPIIIIYGDLYKIEKRKQKRDMLFIILFGPTMCSIPDI